MLILLVKNNSILKLILNKKIKSRKMIPSVAHAMMKEKINIYIHINFADILQKIFKNF